MMGFMIYTSWLDRVRLTIRLKGESKILIFGGSELFACCTLVADDLGGFSRILKVASIISGPHAEFRSECLKREVGNGGLHGGLGSVQSFFKPLGSMLIIWGCFCGCERLFFPMANFLTPVQLLPNMIATGLFLYL